MCYCINIIKLQAVYNQTCHSICHFNSIHLLIHRNFIACFLYSHLLYKLIPVLSHLTQMINAWKSNRTQSILNFGELLLLLLLYYNFFPHFFGRTENMVCREERFLIFSCIFWIIALTGLFELLKEKMPYYSRIGLIIAIYGYVVGINFGFIGFYSEVFNISHQTYIASVPRYSFYFNGLLFWPGRLVLSVCWFSEFNYCAPVQYHYGQEYYFVPGRFLFR